MLGIQRFSFHQISIYLVLQLILSLSLVECHKIEKIIGSNQQIRGYVNQTKTIQIPFKKCYQIEPQLSNYKNYLNFKPSSLKLQSIKQTPLQPATPIKLLDNLRSPNSYKHKDILLFENYILLFMAPRTIIIVKELKDSFEIKNTYQIQQLDNFVQFKMFKFHHEALLILSGRQQILLLGQNSYTNYQLNSQLNVGHLQQVPNTIDQFFTAQFDRGFGHYKIHKAHKNVQLIKMHAEQFFKRNTYIVDFSISQYQNGLMYFLDQNSGVFEVKFQTKLPFYQGILQLIINQPNCQALDNNRNKHFVLVCKMSGVSFITQVFQQQINGQKAYKKVQPSFHKSYFNDVKISGEYYMVFSSKAVNIFLNSLKNDVAMSINTQSQLNLPGLQTFNMVSENILYAVQSGVLYQYIIKEDEAQLLFKSPYALKKDFIIYYYGACSQSLENKPLEATTLACRIQQTLNIEIVQQLVARKSDFSLSAIIIIILIIVFMLVIWICLKKYKGLQKQTRKVLDAYKKKKPTQKFVF